MTPTTRTKAGVTRLAGLSLIKATMNNTNFHERAGR